MWFKFILVVSLPLALIPVNSQAGSFSVIGEDKIWDLVPGTTLNYLIGIENPTGCSDLLMMWGLNLTLRPATQSRGELFIDNAYPPSQNYLFDDRSTGLFPSFIGPQKSIDAIGDYDSELIGFSVPNKGKYLLEMDLHASNDAQGLFYIDVQPLESSSFWATTDDIFSGEPNYRAFDNLPYESSSPVTIGTVLIQNVPEPSSTILLVIGIAFFILRLRQSRNRNGCH